MHQHGTSDVGKRHRLERALAGVGPGLRCELDRVRLQRLCSSRIGADCGGRTATETASRFASTPCRTPEQSASATPRRSLTEASSLRSARAARASARRQRERRRRTQRSVWWRTSSRRTCLAAPCPSHSSPSWSGCTAAGCVACCEGRWRPLTVVLRRSVLLWLRSRHYIRRGRAVEPFGRGTGFCACSSGRCS